MRALASAPASGGVSLRRARGAHYTPVPLVEHLVAEALRGWHPRGGQLGCDAWRLIDPACGSGNFLVAGAGMAASHTGESIESVLEHRVFGVDIDEHAVRMARAALCGLIPHSIDGETRARIGAAIESHVVVADALDPALEHSLFIEPFDLVLGNPPFLNQLQRGTAASRRQAADIAARTGGAVRRYADIAAAFFVLGTQRLAPGGRLAFVMPLSFLSAADSKGARDAVLETCTLSAVWACDVSVFDDADVRACGLVLERGGSAPHVRRAFGVDFAIRPDVSSPPRRGDPSWAPLIAACFGAPEMSTPRGAPIGTIAEATADFRDQFYGLRGAIGSEGEARLMTTRHVDLARSNWNDAPVRVLGERYLRPKVTLAALAHDPQMQRWAAARRVPKVLVSTQTRVMEAWVDEAGDTLPLVPLLTVVPKSGHSLWEVAAAVASPVVAARALQLYTGSALDARAIKLSARQLMAMPLPIDGDEWRASAAHFESASRASGDAERVRELGAFAERSCRAHALSREDERSVLAFWRGRARLG